jgi:hypothetical protein
MRVGMGFAYSTLAMMSASALALASLLHAGFPSPRIALVLEDPQPGQPVRAQLEQALQKRGMELVDADVSERIRKIAGPKALLAERLPDGLTVLEADAILAGSVAYGEPTDFEGMKSVGVAITIRLIDLATGRNTSTVQASGRGRGADGPQLWMRGAEQAVEALFKDTRIDKAFGSVGQASGMVTLFVKDIETREQLLELRRQLERALGGIPVKEIYFAKGLGKLVLGGANDPKAMVGPEVADVLTETKSLALVVEEVANTRIAVRYHRAKAVNMHALVLEPKLPKSTKARAEELGRFLATEIATFEFAKASYQPGQVTRERALRRAKEINADVIIESEVLGSGTGAALSIRVVDTKTGEPILREQRLLEQKENLEVAGQVLVSMKSALPARLGARDASAEPVPTEGDGITRAGGEP